MATIRKIIENTKAAEGNIKGIKVAIKNKSESTFFDNPKEVYFGELSDVPKQFMDFEVIGMSQICASSVENRNGANVFLIAM